MAHEQEASWLRFMFSNSGHPNHSRRLLLGPPLAAVLIFCFGFVLVQERHTGTAHSLAARRQTPSSSEVAPLNVSPPASISQGQINVSEAATPQPATIAATTASGDPIHNPQSSASGLTRTQAPTLEQQSLPRDLKVDNNHPQSEPLAPVSNLFKNLLPVDR